MVAGQKLPDILSIALYRLSNKDSRGFEDILWLAFGDDWTRIRRSLLVRGAIRYHQADDTFSITDEGRRALGAFRRAGHGVEQPETAA